MSSVVSGFSVGFSDAASSLEETAGRETSVFSSQESVREPVSVEAGTNSVSGSLVNRYAPARAAIQSADNPQMVSVFLVLF